VRHALDFGANLDNSLFRHQNCPIFEHSNVESSLKSHIKWIFINTYA